MVAITVSAFVPATISMLVPFLPLASLLVRIVQSSLLDKEVLSIENRLPIFLEKICHSFACGF